MWLSRSTQSRFTLIAVLCAGVLVIERLPAQGLEPVGEQDVQQGEDEDLKKYVDEMNANVGKFQAAKSSEDAGKLTLELFPTRFDMSVRLLATHADPNVALQAAWQRYSRMVRTRDVRFGSRNETLDPRDVQRFLGFVEGRARVLVPNWWERAFAAPSELPREERFRGSWFQLKEIVKKSDDAYVTLEVDFEQIQVPVKTFDSLAPRFGKRLGVAMNDKHLLMMPYRSDGGGVQLACVDHGRSKELWQTKLWGLGEIEGKSGPPIQHYMTMEIVSNRVFVFGATRQGAYFEVYALKDGSRIVRFATNNWRVSKDNK